MMNVSRFLKMQIACFATAAALMPFVAGAQTADKTPAKAPAKTASKAKTADTAKTAEKIDINNASEKSLEDLPGVGPATAKKIVAGRPYAAVGDLAKAGVPAATIEKITPLVIVGKAAAAPAPKAATTAPAPTPAATPAAKTTTAEPAKKATSTVVAQTPPAPGMVWVNLDTKVFHREGDQYFGKTKNGKFMTEADAVKAGYRESKQGAAKSTTKKK